MSKKIFIIEDDPVVVEIYRKKFLHEGYAVEVANDGLDAMRLLPDARPDLIVLDLMLAKFNGADVLKFIRAHAQLRRTKVVIFSNAYMTEIALEAAKAGADASLLKSSCTPAQLLTLVKTLLEDALAGSLPAAPLAAPVENSPAPPPAPAPPRPVTAPENFSATDTARPFSLPVADDARLSASERAHRDFKKQAPAALDNLRRLFADFAQPHEVQTRLLRLQELHRQIHFFCDLAELAGHKRLAHLAAAVEALLFELQERPKHISASTSQTLDAAFHFLGELARRAARGEAEPIVPTNLLAVLVVDDEPLSNRALVHALSRAQVKATSADSPDKALELFRTHHYDLLLLDYLMPGMDGLELYARLREIPRYTQTPVIFVTSATDFRERAREILARGDDVIQKPILPIELAVKSLTLLMKSKLA
ncbi:MAG: Alkaline phosphatase synthesis transcriptional regulatory protein phoP, two-component system, OmpR [Verrucomicrobiota bacterium]